MHASSGTTSFVRRPSNANVSLVRLLDSAVRERDVSRLRELAYDCGFQSPELRRRVWDTLICGEGRLFAAQLDDGDPLFVAEGKTCGSKRSPVNGKEESTSTVYRQHCKTIKRMLNEYNATQDLAEKEAERRRAKFAAAAAGQGPKQDEDEIVKAEHFDTGISKCAKKAKSSVNRVPAIPDLCVIEADLRRSCFSFDVHQNIAKRRMHARRRDIQEIIVTFFLITCENLDDLATLNDGEQQERALKPRYKYFQGFHELTLLILEATGASNIACLEMLMILAKISFFEDFLSPTLAFNESIFPLFDEMLAVLRLGDSVLAAHMDKFDLSLHFAIPWVLTFFCHNLTDTAKLARVWDCMVTDAVCDLRDIESTCSTNTGGKPGTLQSGNATAPFRSRAAFRTTAGYRSLVFFCTALLVLYRDVVFSVDDPCDLHMRFSASGGFDLNNVDVQAWINTKRKLTIAYYAALPQENAQSKVSALSGLRSVVVFPFRPILCMFSSTASSPTARDELLKHRVQRRVWNAALVLGMFGSMWLARTYEGFDLAILN